MSIIYGPIKSWRVGLSFNVDPLCRDPKVCSMNCIYCKFGSSAIVVPYRALLVPTELFVEEMATIPDKEEEVIRFAGAGEPTLALNLKEMLLAAREAGFKNIVVLTNASLLHDSEVREALQLSDIIIAKLDAATEDTFQKVNRPHPDVNFQDIMVGLRTMRGEFRGSFRLQVMLVAENRAEIENIAEECASLDPEIVYLSTPSRICDATPLTRKDMLEAAKTFMEKGCNVALEAMD